MIFGFCFSWSTVLFGQSDKIDSVMHIGEFVVHSSRLTDFSTGQKIIPFDSITRFQNQDKSLAELIRSNTSIQIKSYNYNGLSTIAFRGTSAQHSGIYWNGIQLNPSNSGLLDLQLIPAGFFNRMQVLYGGGSSLFGSGNIGGSIHLGNDPVFTKRNALMLNLGLGSFGENQARAEFEKSNLHYYSKTAVFYRKAKNDFPFYSLQGEKKNQLNSFMEGYGLMQDFFGKMGNGQWGLHVWLQNNFRQIPPSLTTANSDAKQSDRTAKGVLSYQHPIGNAKLKVQAAAVYDFFLYVDPDSLASLAIDSRIETLKYTAEAVYSGKLLGNGQFKMGINNQLETGSSVNWNGDVSRNQLGLFALFKHSIPGTAWNAHVNLRQDFNSDYAIPFSPSFGAEGNLFPKLKARLSISKNYRVPTFNDLFWVPGGNPDIKPEDSWNEEFGLRFMSMNHSLSFKYRLEATAFSSQVDNWIIWVPKASWSEPQNIQQVWARGFELEASAALKGERLKGRLSGTYTFSRSTSLKKRWEFDEAFHKQLIYVPEHRFAGKFTFSYSKYSLSYVHSFTGLQYTSSDNLEFLPAFQTGDLYFDTSLLVHHHQLIAQLQIRNVWDANYQSYQNYPNPGRSFYFSITWQIQSNDHE